MLRARKFSFLGQCSVDVLTGLLLMCFARIDYADVPGRTLRRKARQEYLIYRWFGIGERSHYKQNMTAQLEEDPEKGDQQLNMDLLSALESAGESA